jgi:hypothetical protein
MTRTEQDTRAAEHGSRIITALEAAWLAIRDQHQEVPAAVIITGSGQGRKGVPKGYRLHGHHWPERWVTGADRRAPELFVAGEVLGQGGRAVIEVLLHEAAHAVAAVRGIKDTSAAGHRYHNRRYATIAAELGLEPPGEPHKILGMSDCTLTDATAAGYATAISAIDAAGLPYLADTLTDEAGGPGGDGEDGGNGEDGKPKRDGRRVAAECGCEPARRLQLSPKQIEDGPIICGVCEQPFRVPGQDDDEDQDHEDGGED